MWRETLQHHAPRVLAAQDTESLAQDTKEPAQDTESLAQDTESLAQDTKEPAQDTKEPAQDTKEPAQDTNHGPSGRSGRGWQIAPPVLRHRQAGRGAWMAM